MTLNRRHLLAAPLIALATPSIAQDRPKITIQCYGGLFEKTLREAILPDFQTANGIDVTLAVEDDVTILPKLRAARGRSPWDVCYCDNDIAVLGAQMGVWADDQTAQMPNAARVYANCRPPGTANYGNVVFEYALVHNTKKLPAATSWLDLWRDDIVPGIPHITQSYGLTFLYLAATLHGGSGKNLDPGFAAIKKLKKFRIYKNVSEGLALFQQGEIDAALFYNHRAQQMLDMGLPIAKTRPKEGTWGQHTGAQIPKATQNLAAARIWINHSLGVPYQTAFAKNLYAPTNRDVVVAPELAAKLVYGAERVEGIREAPWEDLLPQRDALLERWTREIG